MSFSDMITKVRNYTQILAMDSNLEQNVNSHDIPASTFAYHAGCVSVQDDLITFVAGTVTLQAAAVEQTIYVDLSDDTIKTIASTSLPTTNVVALYTVSADRSVITDLRTWATTGTL